MEMANFNGMKIKHLVIKIDDEFETMKGFAPFSVEELREVKLEWREHDLREVLTGDMEEDLKTIKKYNEANNL